MIRFLCFFIFMATTAAADGFPAHFNVTGVADDDRLNIRAAPDHLSEIIGDYGPYRLNIEVLRTSNDGAWGYVGLGEGNGWVSMRYLERQNHLTAGEFPRPFTCFGTEPFWNLTAGLRGDEYDAPETGRRDLTAISEQIAYSGNNVAGGSAVFQEGPTLDRTLIFKRGYCGDGMSDRKFGWTAMLFTQAPDGNSVASGCCTMDVTN